jgi:Tfp pilus assembly protein PilF
MNPKGPYTRQEKKSFHDASNYFKEKLNENPNNMRYNYFQASLQQALGDAASSNYHYQEAMNIAPDNVFIRNDFAVHLANQKRYDDAALELNRALVR